MAYRGPDSPGQVVNARIWQGVAAGFLVTGLGALIVTALGTGTVALMPRAGWLMRWLYPGQHLSAAVAYGRELTASMNASGYVLILLAFPIVGLVLGAPAHPGRISLPPATPAHRRAVAVRRISSRRRIPPAAGKLACLPERGRYRTARRVMARSADMTPRTGSRRGRGSVPCYRRRSGPWGAQNARVN